jgi:hypothetical protein
VIWIFRGGSAVAFIAMLLAPIVLVRWTVLAVGGTALAISVQHFRWRKNRPYTEFDEEKGNFKH